MSKIGRFIIGYGDKPFLARRTFTIDKPLVRATARVCGLGQFELYANGQRVSDHELDPGWTDYSKYIEYVTFDLTGYLRQGQNVIAAGVGNGWFIKNDENYTFAFPPFMPPNPNPYKPFGDDLILAAELTIEFADGETEVITADEEWRTNLHYVTQSNVYGSETVDNRLYQPGWNDAGFDEYAWKQAELLGEADEPSGAAEMLDQFHPPIRVIKTYEGKLLGNVNGRDIYTFGQNMSGMLNVTARGKKGDVIRIYPAEKLAADGDVDQVMKGWTTLDAVITFIIGADDTEETFRMHFTYFAGMVVAAEKSSEDVKILDITADAISSAWKTDGSFTCDDDRFNKIYDMVEKSVEANMMSVHTDCPTIERFAWQEPNHLMAPAIMFMKDGSKLWYKFLRDMRAAQHTADDFFYDFGGNKIPAGDGLVPSQAPCYIPNVLPVPGMGSFYDIIPWGSALILGARWHYRFYGDPTVIEENYDAGMRYLNHLKGKVNEGGFLNHGLGDWGNPDNELARENIETAFLYADSMCLAEFAEVLGREDDKAELLAYAELLKANYNEKLLVKDPEGHYIYRSFEHGDENVTTQACEALPLYFGLVPGEAKDGIVTAFRETLESAGCFRAGEVGLPYVIQTAREYGMNDLIAKFILREEHPSYYAFILDGMTTLGEYWETNPRSQCHDMMGHIVEWYYNGIAGIQPQEPGFSRIIIRPYLPESMNSFTCSYDSVRGRITVSVSREDDSIILEYDIPEGVACEVVADILEENAKQKGMKNVISKRSN